MMLISGEKKLGESYLGKALSIIPKPECFEILRGFPDPKPPFKVTNRPKNTPENEQFEPKVMKVWFRWLSCSIRGDFQIPS